MKSETCIIGEDFNRHSQSWGYNHIDNRGKDIEDWEDVFLRKNFIQKKIIQKKYSVQIIYMSMTKIRRYKIINNLK